MKKISLKIIAVITFFGIGLNAFGQQCASNVYTFNYNNKTYKIVKEQKNWANAASCAVSLGGYLVEINDQSEQDSVYAAISAAGIATNYTTVNDGGGIAYVWIGASDQNSEGTWIWDGNGDNVGTNFWNGQGANGANNGTVVGGLFNNWGGKSTGTSKEPDDFNNNQDGAAIGLTGWPSFNPGLLGNASEWNDISSANQLYFIVEYDCMNSQSTISETACNSYTSPSGNYTWTMSATYMDTIPNSGGCDSMITINLTINSVDTSVAINNSTLTANESGATYQWLHCDNGNMPISGATNQSFTATTSGNYAVQVTKNSCIDTSACHSVTIIGTETQIFGADFSIYPNPSNGAFTLDLGSAQNVAVSVKIYDVVGKIVYSKKNINSEKLFIELEGNSALYFVEISDANGKKATLKLLKE